MQGVRRLALTGTPATGKSSVCALLGEGEFEIVTVEELAVEHECIEDVDLYAVSYTHLTLPTIE